MKTSTTAILPADVEVTRRRFEQWRQTRKRPTPIPESLWAAPWAASSSQRFDQGPLARLLHQPHKSAGVEVRLSTEIRRLDSCRFPCEGRLTRSQRRRRLLARSICPTRPPAASPQPASAVAGEEGFRPVVHGQEHPLSIADRHLGRQAADPIQYTHATASNAIGFSNCSGQPPPHSATRRQPSHFSGRPLRSRKPTARGWFQIASQSSRSRLPSGW